MPFNSCWIEMLDAEYAGRRILALLLFCSEQREGGYGWGDRQTVFTWQSLLQIHMDEC